MADGISQKRWAKRRRIRNARQNAADIQWTATSNQDWLNIVPDRGRLASAEEAHVVIGLDTAKASALPPGNYTAAVTITNTTNQNGNDTLTIELTVEQTRGTLAVWPRTGFVSSGIESGDFAP